jgi:hypothetical protein
VSVVPRSLLALEGPDIDRLECSKRSAHVMMPRGTPAWTSAPSHAEMA